MKLDQNYRVSGAYFAKRYFNPVNKDDLEEFRYFMTKGHWREGCPFILEWPHTNVVNMMQDQVTRHYIGSITRAAKPAKAK